MQKYTNLVARLRDKLQTGKVSVDKPNDTKPEEIKNEVVEKQKPVVTSTPTKNTRKKKGTNK